MADPIPFPDPPLAGDGFVLRPFRADDVPADFAATEHPSSARWLNQHSAGEPEAVARWIEDERQAGRMLTLTIAGSATNAYLGAIVLFLREHETGELAYGVAPEARGRGLARGAVQLLGDWAFDQLGLQRLQLRIDPENTASIALAERAGYTREGVLRSAFVVRGRRGDVAMYSRLPGDN